MPDGERVLTASVMSPDTHVLIWKSASAQSQDPLTLTLTYDERQRRHEREEQPRSRRCKIRDDDFYQQYDHRVPDLVEHGPATELGHPVGRGFHNGTDHVKDDTDDDEFDTAEDIGDFGRSGLWNASVKSWYPAE